MLPYRFLGVLPLLMLVTACATEHAEAEGGKPLVETTRQTAGREAIRVSKPLVETTRQTADGEYIRVKIPEQIPVVEVAEGAPCGVQNAEGAMLSCQAGTFCTSPREGAAATCARGLRAPVTH
jgi:hypothetical protein